jgi:predicted MPP superfamily phosphohydrolase
MFEDLQVLWQELGQPAFIVSPGDLVEAATPTNHQLAQADLRKGLGDLPFYPGVGNHEYWQQESKDFAGMAAVYTETWGKPLRYWWQTGDVLCIMLDYPATMILGAETPDVPALPGFVDSGLRGDPRMWVSEETLAFLDRTLQEHPEQPTIIFLHSPLHNTVLEREPGKDYHSLQHFFAPENSQAIRDILARHKQAGLFLSGHTHSGWDSPNLVKTEQLGGHPVTFLNLMSPWYTGSRGTGMHGSRYVSDDPDVIPSFCMRLDGKQATIRLRDHLSKTWLKEWTVPVIS